MQKIHSNNAILAMAFSNYFSDEADELVGLRTSARFNVGELVLQQNAQQKQTLPLVINNINVSNSTIGTLNTGTIKRLDETMNCLKSTDQNEVYHVSKPFIETILNDANIDTQTKNELIETISLLISQIPLKQEDRKTGLLKASFEFVKQKVTTLLPVVANLATVWDVFQPLIKAKLGIG